MFFYVKKGFLKMMEAAKKRVLIWSKYDEGLRSRVTESKQIRNGSHHSYFNRN